MKPILSGDSPTNQNPFQVDIDFGEFTDSSDALDAFAAVNVTNGSVVPGSLTLASPGQDQYSFEVTPGVDGPVSLFIPAGAYICTTSGTPNEASNVLTVVFDSTQPIPHIALRPGESNPTNEPFWVRINFSEDIDSADLPAIEAHLTWTNCFKGSGGTSGWNTTSDPQMWDLHVNPVVEGTLSLRLGAGAYVDQAGNSNTQSNLYSNEYDVTPPEPFITLRPGESDPTNGPFLVRIHFHADIDSGDLPTIEGHLTWTNCTKGSGGIGGWSSTGDPTIWDLHVNPTAEGTVSLRLGAGAYTDEAGNPSLQSNLYTNEYDITPPEPFISLQPGENDPTNGPFWARIDFGAEMEGADLTGVETHLTWTNCSKGTGGTGGWSSTGDPEVWDLNVIPTTEGTALLRLGAGAYTDEAGNANVQSNLFDIVYDITPPTPNITLKPGESDPVDGPFWVRIDFHEEIDSGDLAGIEAALIWTNCSKGTGGTNGWTNTPSPEVWDLHVVPTEAGSVSLQLGAGAYTDDAGNSSALSNLLTVTYSVPTAGRDVVMMMDFSNSMNWLVTIGSETKPKIDFMLPAISQFIDEWSAFINPGDRFGLVPFESVATKLTSSLQLFNVADAQTLVNSVTAKGNTAMGAALGLGLLDLLSANQSAAAYGRKRDAILFADGQENIHPRVTTTSNSFSVAAMNNAGYPYELGPLTVTAGDPDNIPVHTVGIGEAASWLDRLNHISAVSGGVDKAAPTAQIWPGMINGLQDILTEIYSDSSPQVVFRNKGQLAPPGKAGAEKTETVVLDGSVQKVLISVSWLGDAPLELEVKKNGKQILKFDQVTRRDDQRYLILELRFPHFSRRLPQRWRDAVAWPMVTANRDMKGDFDTALARISEEASSCAVIKEIAGPDYRDVDGRVIPPDILKPLLGYVVTARGSFEVTVKRVDPKAKGTIDYNLSVIADEKAVDCIVTQPSWVFTGSPIRFCVRVREDNGKPIDRLLFAEVKISHARRAVADVLAKYKRRLPKIKIEKWRDGNSLLSVKMATLHQIPKAAMELRKTVINRIRLTPPRRNGRTRGICCGLYRSPKVPGVYRIQYTIRGISRTAGMFERVIERTVLVKPRISRRHTKITSTSVTPKGDVCLTIIPKDAYRNLLGPGYAETLNVNLISEKKIEITDNFDGSYTVVLPAEQLRIEDNLTVHITVMKRTVYRGSLKALIAKC